MVVAKLKKVSFGWPVQQPQKDRKDQAENFTTMHSGLDTLTEPLNVNLVQEMVAAIGNDSRDSLEGNQRLSTVFFEGT